MTVGDCGLKKKQKPAEIEGLKGKPEKENSCNGRKKLLE